MQYPTNFDYTQQFIFLFIAIKVNIGYIWLFNFKTTRLEMGNIIINRLDYTRIKNCINDAREFRSVSLAEANTLLKELDSATIVEPADVPADVVTMNSIVKLSFLNNNKQVQFRIVYPKQANLRENKISIFSPIATALIGYKAGDEVEWIVPAGLTKIRIDEIIYQPEAAGEYNL